MPSDFQAKAIRVFALAFLLLSRKSAPQILDTLVCKSLICTLTSPLLNLTLTCYTNTINPCPVTPAIPQRLSCQKRFTKSTLGPRSRRAITSKRRCHSIAIFPFARVPAIFCGCNTVITQRKSVADPYLDALIRNIEQVAALTSDRRPVNQLHWGGGTPNYLTLPQIDRLWQALNQHFTLATNAEISIEVNPAYLSREQVFFPAAAGVQSHQFWHPRF